MPYSHLPQMGRERFEESSHLKMANCLDNLASVPDHELVELVWENGQVVMQGGQSNKTRKSSPSNVFSSHGYKAQGKDEGNCVLPKLERFGNGDAAVNDFSSSGHMGLGQDDELARWLNYPLDDYCSDFFSELTGVNQNAVSTQNNAPQANQVGRDSRRGSTNGGVNSEIGNASKVAGEGHDHTRARGNYMGSSVLQQCQTSVPSHRSRVSEFSGRSAQPSHYGASNQTPSASTDVMPNSKIHMQEREATRLPPKPSNNTGFTNFSHFLRPATFAKSNQRTVAAATGPDFLSKDRIQSNNKASVASSSNAIESTVMGSNTVSRSIAGSQSRHIPLPGKVDMKSSTHNPSKESESVCQEDAFSKNKSSNQTLGRTLSFTASTAAGRPDTDKGIEPVVASSSVCSGNSTGGTSNDPRLELKRKSRETEQAESPSEDVEAESVGARKPTTGRGGSGTKRSRAAEVHNLSERKRRDRINEKMRALQELIPNCNKVDKASMLDEAIEYLKTLQLQVQIMSMGTGLYMPPMMLPNGMQHMHASFSPMSVGMGMGMGMGMGFGMGMFNVAGGSSSCPLIQPPPMLGAHFPGPPISGPSGMPMMSGSNHPIFGLPGEGQPMSMPRVPYDPLSGGSSASLPVVSGVSTSLHAPSSFVVPCQKDPLSNINTQTLKTHAECPQNHLSIQDQATEGRDQSALVHRNDQPPQATDNRVNASLL